MGMAAGQARLLSITSRMSDNELRAQVINNNKMRLATQSSQVSEAYVSALNEAQMMFTNYDADNKASYQRLTYNALTSYNPYNNQYIVTNSSGNVLLSEDDAVKYKDANGDLEKFLKSYGLEKTTTYFDNLAEHYTEYTKEDGTTAFGIEYKAGFDLEGNELLGYINTPEGNGTGEDIAKYIQDLYEGNIETTYNRDGKNVKLHPGYMAAVSSEDYYNYTKKLEDFDTKRDAYLEIIAQLMSDKLNSFKSTQGINDKNLNDLKGLLSETDKSTNSNVLKALGSIVDQADDLAINDDKSKKYFNDLKELINNNTGEYAIDTYSSADNYKLELNAGTLILKDEADAEIGSFTMSGGNINGISVNAPTLKNGNYEYTYLDGEEVSTISIPQSYFTAVPDNWLISESSPNSAENMKSVAEQLISSLQTAIFSVWDPLNKEFTPKQPSDYGWNEYQAYLSAGKALSEEIFGSDIGEENYANLDNTEWCHQQDAGKFTGTKQNDFEKIYDVYILDNLMNTYGEPKYAWIDKNNPNENGEAKAQWYENLFTRIQKSGFKVLQDGLASSSEWIQFAFESGIINMEQLDANLNWNPIIYSSCSDITEQTNDAAIAKAEAEYKSAMNKIENKDKRYDLELKNIDTEHNSLQTEYESIKTAIDKNIERTFKLYS